MSTQPLTDQSVTREELLGRARALMPAIKERAAETAATGRVPDETVEEIVGAQLNRIGVPVRFGGFDVEYEVLHEVAIELARVCGATSWCSVLWGVHGYWLAFFPLQAQEELYADGPDVLTSSATFSARSEYERVSGGWRVSGHWRFVSGCDHAAWVFADVFGAEGRLTTIIPRSQLRIVEDTWNVSGLQGTGSKDIVIEDVFVPDHRAQFGGVDYYEIDAPAQRPRFDEHPQRRYTVPKFALLVWDLVAPAIGLGQGAVDEMVARLRGTSGRATAADSPIVQNKIAESAAEIDTARTLMHADFEHAQRIGERGEKLTMLDLSRYARDRAYAVQLAVSATNRMFDMAGGRALFLSDPMQRIHRDVQAAMHRDGLVFDFASQAYGRALLGMDPRAVVLRKQDSQQA